MFILKPDFFDDMGGGSTGSHLGKNNLAAMLFHDLSAADVVSPVCAFNEDVGDDLGDEFGRFRFVEDDDIVDGLKGGEDASPVTLRHQRAKLSLVSPHGGVGVEPDDQSIALLTREGEVIHMSGVENVEAAVGEDKFLPLCAERATYL